MFKLGEDHEGQERSEVVRQAHDVLRREVVGKL
jgi:hypothetical protein